ncbi:MAG: FmdE family protein [Coriobacteriales bacterium]|jgi:formylmethanofuran dehydrogenase subunit E|nr:FmdE family protein [Coriobacteriales bacterium]
MMVDDALWRKAVAFHGHECPGLAIGFAAALGAIAELGLEAAALPATDEEIVCVTENDACGVDAIQVVLGCTYGKANLIPRLRGKMAFSFFTRPRHAPGEPPAAASRAVRLMLRPEAGAGLSRAEFQRHLLEAPYEELFELAVPGYGLPEAARLFASHPCSVCGEKTAEPFLRVVESEYVCLDCYQGYQREGFK